MFYHLAFDRADAGLSLFLPAFVVFAISAQITHTYPLSLNVTALTLIYEYSTKK